MPPVCKRILVPTDLSEASYHAFPLVRSVASLTSASIVLLAVAEDPTELALFAVMDNPTFLAADYQVAVMEKIRESLKEISGQHFSNLPVECVLREGKGSVASTIVSVSRELDCDLIVIAAQGHSALGRVVLGSVSERVVRESSVPVLVIPAQERSRQGE